MKQTNAIDEQLGSSSDEIKGKTLKMAIIALMNNNTDTILQILFCIIYSPPDVELNGFQNAKRVKSA